jgi:MoaA/NifB/PqqE/SkfB family radical SAM enzyme
MRTQLSINLSVARACFVRCNGCYNHFGETATLADSAGIVSFLAYARARGVGKVTLCGGDPLARPDILSLVTDIKQLGFSINLDTVGTPLLGATPTIFFGRREVPRVDAGTLASQVDLIGIPLDGSSNESVARFRGGRKHLFDEQVSIIELLGAAGASVCVNTVVHRSNLDDVERIVRIVARYPSVVRWQLFQFMPTGPLGYRNRASYVIDDASFTALEKDVRRAAVRDEVPIDIEFKANADRTGNYLLIDSDGKAWVPAVPVSGEWDGHRDATDRRIVIGDIRNPADHAPILQTVLQPQEILPSMLPTD